MLEHFSDFPTQTGRFYAATTGRDDDGLPVVSYALRETRELWVFQKTALQKYFGMQVIDTLDLTAITDEACDKTDLLLLGPDWYSITYPDDILGAGEVTILGLTKVKAPANVSGTVDSVQVLGDFAGVV